MDFRFSEQQEASYALAGRILDAQVSQASLRELEAEGAWLHEPAYRALAQAGLLGAGIEEAFGGTGAGRLLDWVPLLEQVGRHVAPLPVLPLVWGALAVQRYGAGPQKRRLLPGVVRGELLLSAALEEPGAVGGDAPCTRFVIDGGGYRLHGTRPCVPLGDRAARVITPACDAEGHTGLFLVDPRGPGVQREQARVTHGMPVSHVTLQGVRVEAEDVLVAPAHEGDALTWLRDAATVAVCALQLGVAAQALSITARYTETREQFGRPLGSFQAVRQRAADAYIDLESLRLATLQAAWRLDQGRDARLAVSAAKALACEGGYRVVYAAQHLHGGVGYDTDYPLHRYYRWAKALELTLGAAPWHLARIGRLLRDAPVRIAG